MDNQLIERFFRTYKWEKLYLEVCETGHHLWQVTREYVEYYKYYDIHKVFANSFNVLVNTVKKIIVCHIIVRDIEEAEKRVGQFTASIDAKRLGKDTPCTTVLVNKNEKPHF